MTTSRDYVSSELVGYTTQAHTVTHTNYQTKRVEFSERVPAGTEVIVSHIKPDGTCRIRIPGTSLTQIVYLSTIEPA